ncbi:protein ENHANCED DISEASE RESISTANCE 4-like [Salvia miltiorrhiza]|uniref:protein ENHANCED DISEASE RESISTANCE 4-like n=1 Tax=Salvia miltiorrhiza TaxID=226208 RepID=UPI0025AB7920|nr:protein ENHANCED DISEASE RESISTANCE 4-like [Salvia miltiorrhiza]XP_057778469.1 protein ENHANCED DISEASE RESISTANCE 4-like [Salvia miltiorrhiza]
MTTQGNVQIRFVKCPRCRKILPELPELRMYKCGGCGITLQAKQRKPETNHTELPSQETDSADEDRKDNVLGETEDRSSNVESSPDEGEIRRQDDCDGSVVLSHNRGASDGLSGSPDITSPRSEGSPSEVEQSCKNNALGRNPETYRGKSEDECDDSVELPHYRGASDGISGCETSPSEVQESLEDNPLVGSPQKYRSKSDDHEEWIAGSNSLDELPSSGEISLEGEVCTPEASEYVEQHNPSHMHLEHMEDGESQRVWPKGDNLVDEVQNLAKHEDQESDLPESNEANNVVPENEGMTRTNLTDQNGDSSGEIKHVGPISPSEMISHEIGITSSAADDGSKGLPVSTSPSTEKSTSPKASDSIHAPQSPSKGSLVSFYLTSDDEQLFYSPREFAHKFERFSSMDTLGSSHLGEHSSELNVTHGSTAYHPRSRSYYAYDGSESSYDGNDDQVRKHVSHPSRKDKDMRHIRTREELRKSGFSGNNMVQSEAERTYRATSPLRREMHRPWNRGKSTEANRCSDRNRMRLDAQEDVSRLPFPSRDHTAGCRTAGVSVRRLNLLPPHPAFNLSDKSSYSDPEKIDLLRTVHHLKDQLERMHFNALPCSLLAAEREVYADVSRSGPCNRRHEHAKGYGERYNERRMAFSGEAAHFRHQASCSCVHCSPRDWHYRRNGHHAIPSDHNCYDSSNSLSPHHYASSEPSPWGRETKPDTHRLDEMKRLHLREKYSTAKRHLLPIAGGAPVIVCYHCSELLQLPLDFLLFKKRYHQLMCNACRKILKFSLLKGTRLVPYVADTCAPPPSEADDYNDANGRRNLEPASHPSSCQHVESVSCSDDYGRSFCRSCSTEGDAPASLPSLGQVKRDSYNRKMSSGNSYVDEKLKGISKESVGSVGPSSRTVTWRNVTTSASEIEELPPLSNSPLHRLMGYSTPSQVFKR